MIKMYDTNINNAENKFRTLETKKGIFILPKNVDLRNTKNFNEIKFAIIEGKKPVICFYPKPKKYNKNYYATHFELLVKVLEKKYNTKYEYKNMTNLTKNLVFGTYDVNKKKIIYNEKIETPPEKEKELKAIIEKILNTKKDKDFNKIANKNKHKSVLNSIIKKKINRKHP
jgi:ribosomal protein L17